MYRKTFFEHDGAPEPEDLLDLFLRYPDFTLTNEQIMRIESKLDRLIMSPDSSENDLVEISARLADALSHHAPECDELEDARLSFVEGIDPRQVVDMIHAYRHIVNANTK